MRYAYIYPGPMSGTSTSKMVWILKSDKEIDVYANTEEEEKYWKEYFVRELKEHGKVDLHPVSTSCSYDMVETGEYAGENKDRIDSVIRQIKAEKDA
jgi:thymidylate synthase